MAELDITLTIYSDKNKSNQVARLPLFMGAAVNYNVMACWNWAIEQGFTVYNPSIYEERFKELYKDAGTDIEKSKIVKWLDEYILSTTIGAKVDGATALEQYPDTFIFNLKFVDWS